MFGSIQFRMVSNERILSRIIFILSDKPALN